MPIRLRDRVRIDHRLLRQPEPLHARYVDDAVDDGVRDVHASGAEFSREALREGADGKFHGGEGGEEGGTFGGGCCAGCGGWGGGNGVSLKPLCGVGERDWKGFRAEGEGVF